MNSLLPQIIDRNHYQKLFSENSHWEKAITYLIHKHNLTGPVSRGVLGSHIVYRVGDCWVKLMAPLFAHDMAFEMSGLRAVEGKLSVQTPKILASGVLEAWPYVILSHVEGQPVRNVWKKFDLSQKTSLVEQIGNVTLEISKCHADEIIKQRFEWNEFIQKQYDSCEEQQQKKGLTGPWLAGVRKFLHSFDISEFQTKTQVFLHADLTFDHFLVSGDLYPQISGVIDLADCQVGHFEYELVAPAVFILKGQKELLQHFLKNCGVSADKGDRFSEKLLAWSILHRYFSMISYFQEELNTCAPGDFQALAKKIFPLN